MSAPQDPSSPRRRGIQPRKNAFAPTRQPAVPQRPAPQPVRPPQLAAATPGVVPGQTPPLTLEQLQAAQYADSHAPQYIAGYDPAVVPPPTYVPSESSDDEGDGDDDDEEYVGEAGEFIEVGEDEEEEPEQADAAPDPWDDGQLPPPPPTAMPVEYSGWLDLRDIDDHAMAKKFRGWKIRIRLDLSLDFLAAAQALQDAARQAKRLQQKSGGRVAAEVRIEHIRAVLADVLVAWNYVDERGYALPQPPLGLGGVRGDLLAATLNRAMMEITPNQKRLRASTPR